MVLILYSPSVTIEPIGLCSAQIPIPERVSMQTPVYTRPLRVTSAQPTSAIVNSRIFFGLTTEAALAISSWWVTVSSQDSMLDCTEELTYENTYSRIGREYKRCYPGASFSPWRTTLARDTN